MSCLPNTPIAANILSDPAALGWSDVGASLLTTSLARYYPIVGAFVTVRAMTTTNQHAIIRQVDFEETAATSGDIKKHPLLVYVLGAGAGTSPAGGAVYEPDMTYLLGQFAITAADYVRTTNTKWTASIKPNLYIRQTTAASAQNLLLAIVSDSASSVSYASGAAGRVRLFVEQATALS
jgi:hypothetical protein